ncbi:MAG: acyloxyacyl hydrolase [Daejeonella sp.]
MKKIYLLFISALFILPAISLTVKGQLIPKDYSLIIQPAFGSVVINDQNGFLQGKLYGIDISYLKDISRSEDNWIKRIHAKSYGIGFVMRDLNHFNGYGNSAPNSFGQAYGLISQLEVQLLKIGRAELKFSPELGLSYLTKTFFTNSPNRFIGTHINMTLKADLTGEIPITQNISLLAGAGTLHYSNGAFIIPNGGLNTLNVFAGMRFNHLSEIPPIPKKPEYLPYQKNSIELGFGIGRRGIAETRQGKYRSGFYAGYNYRLNNLITLKGGFDAIYSYKYFDPLQTEGKYKYYAASYDQRRLGLSLGADINIWKLAINAQAGDYLYFKRFYDHIKWYWRFGPTYFITPRLGIQTKVYMHLSQADYINYGLVYQF